ncbi:PREDICTED: cuticlin-1-like [Priapulus caudatus]|uniref:Cuticlin-1-like n=1 Tax=Priapulus caudatus TaxID=37621 RepID=A0ABM1F244_PRICU|nr:PREDICTED: cuticlin-1-like [Priapulus caudatus]
MLYPKGLSKNERCVTQGNGSTLLTVRVPYEDCDTLREDTDDGNRSFTSTVVVQSHPLLVTGDDTAYQIGCYLPLTAWKDVNTRFRVSTVTEPPEPLWATPAMPACWLLISATLGGAAVRGAVGVGDPLFFSVEMDKSATYGFTVHNCSVRDDVMGMSQTLIDENGCAVDERLFGQFTYDQEAQRVYTEFHAFRFPNRAQVLFRCDVRLCLKPRCVIRFGKHR